MTFVKHQQLNSRVKTLLQNWKTRINCIRLPVPTALLVKLGNEGNIQGGKTSGNGTSGDLGHSSNAIRVKGEERKGLNVL